MNVLHVLDELRASGAEVMLAQAIPRWRDRGIRSDIVATGRRAGRFVDDLRAAGCDIHHLPFEPAVGFLRRYVSLVGLRGYDVVHVHPERGSFWYALLARMRGARVVRTVHNVFEYTGWLRLERIAQRALLRLVGVHQVSVGASVRENERARFRNPTLLIDNWVDTDAYRPPTSLERRRARLGFGVDDGTTVVTSVGNCAPAKNHEAIIRALNLLPDALDWCYLHAGEEERGRLERALAREVGVADRCRFLGRFDSRTVLAATDVFVMPSFYEGLGNAALEAMSVGIPSVLADCPGLRDLRALDVDGIIWARPTAEATAQGIEAAVRISRDVADRLARHDAVRARYGVERGAADYEQLYRGETPGSAHLEGMSARS